MMYLGNLVSTLASAKCFVAVARVGTLVIFSSLVWQTVRTVLSMTDTHKKKEVSAM